MRYVRDATGRFPSRPYYDQHELDSECERAITEFLLDACGKVTYPIPTDLLTKLIERDADDLDLYADLAAEGEGIQGVTEFVPGARPRVRISKDLSGSVVGEHRLRTTLTHEYGHVRFHDCLFQVEDVPTLFDEPRRQSRHRCNRDSILHAKVVDWMEWQAGYASGALLMPLGALKKSVAAIVERAGHLGQVEKASPLGRDLVAAVATKFAVSEEAAEVRLLKLQLVVGEASAERLFP